MTPGPIAPPAMLVPDPRGTSDERALARPAHERHHIVGIDRNRDARGNDPPDPRRLGVDRARASVVATRSPRNPAGGM